MRAVRDSTPRVMDPKVRPGGQAGGDTHDPYAFWIDLSRYGMGTARVVFATGRPGGPERIAFELYPLSLRKKRR